MSPTQPTRLSVNVNKVALLRNSRPLDIPDVRHLAGLAIAAGAHGITVHPRPDERHIRRSDVGALREMARDGGVEFNIEGNPFHMFMEVVRNARPDQCTLVPDEPGASTSDHGWDLARDATRLQPVLGELKSMGIRVSLFMDAQPQAMVAAAKLGADRVELYTEPYARAFGTASQSTALDRYRLAAQAAVDNGLGVNAGHDLNRKNLPAFLRSVAGVQEVSIGHALVADALEFGMVRAVEMYLDAIRAGQQA
ncbi:MAG TPA: pyridoxine 5'-phosphate synthase [Burkholderiales bacterium]|nr:pyridoxine 5'-phosphate synthase [Burkholderiales bacterium]